MPVWYSPRRSISEGADWSPRGPRKSSRRALADQIRIFRTAQLTRGWRSGSAQPSSNSISARSPRPRGRRRRSRPRPRSTGPASTIIDEHQVEVMNHQVEHHADVRSSGTCRSRAGRRRCTSGTHRSRPSRVESTGLNRSMWPTWSTAPCRPSPGEARRVPRPRSAGAWPAASSTIVAMPRLEERPGDRAVQGGRHGDRDGIDAIEQVAVVGASGRAVLPGDGAGLFNPAVGDPHELDPGDRRQDSRVVLTEMPDPDDRDSQPRHDKRPLIR